MSVTFNDFLAEQLQDPEFKKEYEELQLESSDMQAENNAILEASETKYGVHGSTEIG